MTYSATTWQTGDLITAALLNNTESQYNTYSTDWGYIKLNTLSAATTDTVIAFDQSTYSIGVSGGYKKWLAIRLPPNVQSTKCLLRMDFSIRTCSGSTTWGPYMRKVLIDSATVGSTVAGSETVLSLTTAWKSTNQTVTLAQGETVYISPWESTLGIVVKDIRYYAVVSAPSTSPDLSHLY